MVPKALQVIKEQRGIKVKRVRRDKMVLKDKKETLGLPLLDPQVLQALI
jgi:hypothetical protein